MTTISSFNKVLPNLIEQSGRKVVLDDMTPAAMPSGMPSAPTVGEAAQPKLSFSEMLVNSINSVNQMQQDSASAQTALLNGEPVELHDVMIKAEEAGLSLDLMLEIRNKLLNGYSELIHMQI